MLLALMTIIEHKQVVTARMGNGVSEWVERRLSVATALATVQEKSGHTSAAWEQTQPACGVSAQMVLASPAC